jgi:hypothetical protein
MFSGELTLSECLFLRTRAMKHDVQQDNELRRYLLGELLPEEQALVGQRLFFDSDYAELLQAVEDDLIDEYLADELKGREREKFENHFLQLPEHRADLKIAQALKRYLGPEPTPSSEPNPTPATPDDDEPSPVPPVSFFSNRFVWLSLAVAALIIVAVISWIAIRSTRGPAADGPVQAGDPQPANTRPDDRQQPAPLPNNDNRTETAEKGNANESGARPENLSLPPDPVYVATKTEHYTLSAGNPQRGGRSRKVVRIFADTKEVKFTLPLEFSEPYERYRAELLRGERKIDERSDLKSESDEKFGSVVSVTFPADLFREQSYRIKLHAVPTDQQAPEPPVPYPFNVERK